MSELRIPDTFPSPADVADMRVVITGAGRGLGVLIATAFHRLGARTALVGRNEENLEKVAASLGDGTLVVSADVSVPGDNERVVETVVSEWGGLDVWIGNAGISPVLTPVTELDDETWRSVIDVNLNGAFLGMRTAARALGPGGRIIVTGSVLAERPRVGLSAYSASKAALIALVKALALELADAGITVNAVNPGWFDSPLTEPWQRNDRLGRSVLDHTAIGRWGQSEELVGPYLFLASAASSYVTGSVISVDGGYLCV